MGFLWDCCILGFYDAIMCYPSLSLSLWILVEGSNGMQRQPFNQNHFRSAAKRYLEVRRCSDLLVIFCCKGKKLWKTKHEQTSAELCGEKPPDKLAKASGTQQGMGPSIRKRLSVSESFENAKGSSHQIYPISHSFFSQGTKKLRKEKAVTRRILRPQFREILPQKFSIAPLSARVMAAFCSTQSLTNFTWPFTSCHRCPAKTTTADPAFDQCIEKYWRS